MLFTGLLTGPLTPPASLGHGSQPQRMDVFGEAGLDAERTPPDVSSHMELEFIGATGRGTGPSCAPFCSKSQP